MVGRLTIGPSCIHYYFLNSLSVSVLALPETPALVLPKGIHQDRQSTLRCAGGIGKSESSISIASMYMEIKSEVDINLVL